MPLQASQEKPGFWVWRASGALKRRELATAQAELVKSLPPAGMVKSFIILENFTGWQRGEDWGDVSFFFEHGDKIEKIAIVGDPRWESQVLVFAGAGLRRAPVKFFRTGQEQEARAWLG